MTALNVARGAKPGARFTDPDGGTWVRVLDPWSAAKPMWWRASADGKTWGWRSQEEAEAAGLVELGTVNRTYAAPVPLDPSNPDDLPEFEWNNSRHLRWLADAVTAVSLPNIDDDGLHAEYAEEFATHWRAVARSLDAERAEQAQDEADEKRARQYSVDAVGDEGYWDLALRVIRAERARASAEDES